jgi:hypothetical protein
VTPGLMICRDLRKRSLAGPSFPGEPNALIPANGLFTVDTSTLDDTHREVLRIMACDKRVLRGGSFRVTHDEVTVTHRGNYDASVATSSMDSAWRVDLP